MARNRRIRPITSQIELVQANAARGGNYFTPATMRFFRSRLHDVIPTKFGALFITSERDKGVYISSGYVPGSWEEKRRYTVRFMPNRRVWTESYGYVYPQERGEIVSTGHDTFMQHATLRAARKQAEREATRLAGLLIKDKPILFVERRAEASNA